MLVEVWLRWLLLRLSENSLATYKTPKVPKPTRRLKPKDISVVVQIRDRIQTHLFRSAEKGPRLFEAVLN